MWFAKRFKSIGQAVVYVIDPCIFQQFKGTLLSVPICLNRSIITVNESHSYTQSTFPKQIGEGHAHIKKCCEAFFLSQGFLHDVAR